MFKNLKLSLSQPLMCGHCVIIFTLGNKWSKITKFRTGTSLRYRRPCEPRVLLTYKFHSLLIQMMP